MSENIQNQTKSLNVNYKDIVSFLTATFLIAVSSQIYIPLPNGVPMTLQTFTIAFIGFNLSCFLTNFNKIYKIHSLKNIYFKIFFKLFFFYFLILFITYTLFLF